MRGYLHSELCNSSNYCCSIALSYLCQKFACWQAGTEHLSHTKPVLTMEPSSEVMPLAARSFTLGFVQLITTSFLCRQAWTEWLSNAKAVLTMNPWFGTTRAGGAAPLLDLVESLARGLGQDVTNLDKDLKGRESRAGKADQTKTSSPSTESALGVVRVASGFEELYRRFTATPGNTLSLQAHLVACLNRD